MGLGLNTDLYQLTMAAGYFAAGRSANRATFELSFRRMPESRRYILAAGLAQAVDYLQNLRFTKNEVDYLRGLSQFRQTPVAFFDALSSFRFTGDVFAVPEGTPVFPNEPIVTVRAPVMEAQIVETYLLSMIGYQSMIATKAARIVRASMGRAVVEFGTRRAHSPEAGVLAGRAAYIGGCVGTSNTETGLRFGVPVLGTASHSWVMTFPQEIEAFQRLQSLLGDRTVYLIDSYDTLEGARRAASLGQPLWGVRLDSGNLVELAPAVRKILDDAGLIDAKIMVTGDMNEYRIHELLASRVPIDMFGAGTDLAASADAPTLGVIYKMVEIEDESGVRYPVKLSQDKHTLPGAKQIFRYPDHDVIGRGTECKAGSEALVRPVMIHGELVEPLPKINAVRDYAAESLAKLPPPALALFEGHYQWRVDLSDDLKHLSAQAESEAAEK